MSNTTIMVFNPKRDYALLLIIRNDGQQHRIITSGAKQHQGVIQSLVGLAAYQALSIVVIPGDSYQWS
jgi:hypothetical protein